ncbi:MULTISPECIES: winged helix-turn-helix transcriptional regulator [Pseudovibrio]|uniref:winged helix-turn-helix transcriptional regulator n=1 Tax=Stappiaceae TaxID=2821832 RepID=UPI0023670C1D|nr:MULTISPECIES: helix-turn-helix domain-containing protein [Pseudovibrio]MDD7911236.1 helix-turn-helix domain-containing protein [Pseudovibrio exalbescens]MDX5593077.1 helix-turn-helix domain-containing protein [Pseudovibrio sp. SPO723]
MHNSEDGHMAVCLEPCPIEKAMRVIGGKWRASLLWHLKDGPVRFNELCRILGGATKTMIDKCLKDLEAHGLVKREVQCERPIAVTYEITEYGRTTLAFLDELRRWSEETMKEQEAA